MIGRLGFKLGYENRVLSVVGNGSKVNLWANKWIGEGTLRSRCPRLYSISNYKDNTIGVLMV